MLMRRCQRLRPVLRSRARSFGACGSAIGMYAVLPEMAALPLIGFSASYCQISLPVVALMPNTKTPFEPATRRFLLTVGGAVKSPWWEWKLHAGPRFGTWAAVGPFVPPLRVLLRSWP